MIWVEIQKNVCYNTANRTNVLRKYEGEDKNYKHLRRKFKMEKQIL